MAKKERFHDHETWHRLTAHYWMFSWNSQWVFFFSFKNKTKQRTIVSNLRWLPARDCGACSGVWPMHPASLHWGDLNFLLPTFINYRHLLDQGRDCMPTCPLLDGIFFVWLELMQICHGIWVHVALGIQKNCSLKAVYCPWLWWSFCLPFSYPWALRRGLWYGV